MSGPPRAGEAAGRHSVDWRFGGVLACFVLSGFAGLLYQTAWTRQFSFAFGTSSLAVATVLAAYMGGLAAGAALAARFLPRVRRPLLTYGLLEGGVALAALGVPFAVEAAGDLRAAWLGGGPIPSEGGVGAAGFYLFVSFLVLCIPTALMGATLPLLTRHAVHNEAQIGPRIGALYTTNTLGAVAGTLATAFVLLPALGLGGTIRVGVATNALVLLVAWALARGSAPTTEPAPAAEPAVHPIAARGGAFLAIAFGAGVASFTFEVLWTRLLEHVLGGSVFAFATMLASFLVGIALGAAVAARLATSPGRAAAGLAFSQVGAGVLALAAYVMAQGLPELAAGLGEASPLRRLLTLSLYGGAMLLPSALCIGATFPFVVRAIVRGPEDSGGASARVYAWNTLGAIVGSVGAGFVIIPWLGYEGTLRATVLLNVALGAGAALFARPPSRSALAVASASLLALAWVAPSPPWTLLRSRAGGGVEEAADEVLYYGVGRGGTVLLTRRDRIFRLWTNGLPEAGVGMHGQRPGIGLTARWLGALPALRPGGSKHLLVVGLGGGTAVESVPPSVEQVEVIEIEEEVVAANRAIANRRAHDPLADPRVAVRVNDARGALRLTGDRFDAIVSQPSHPWTAGASHLYTREFFELVKSRLEPGGVFVQWIGLGFADEPLLRSLAATLGGSFAHVRAYQPNPAGLLFLASNEPLADRAEEARRIAADAAAFAELGVRGVEDLIALQALDERGVALLGAGAPLIRDDHNLFATRSPFLVRKDAAADSRRVLAEYDPLRGSGEDVDLVSMIRRLATMGQRERAKRLAGRVRGETERIVLSGELHLRAGREHKMVSAWRRALGRDPGLETPRYRLAEHRTLAGEAVEEAFLEPLSAPARAVVRGLALRRDGRWEELAALEPALSRVDYRHAARDGAVALRAEWRLHRDDPALAREALAVVDADAFGWPPARLLLRARAALAAERFDVAISTLHDIIGLSRGRAGRLSEVADGALRVLAAIPRSELADTQRDDLRVALRRLAGTQRSGRSGG